MAESPIVQQRVVTILIVEDSPTQADQLRHYLEKGGFSVESAINGREALARIEARQPDLVITDIVMPEMDGYQLCRTIKSNPASQHIPVIVVTALTGWDDITRSLECGAENFLRKPYEPQTLVSRVNYILLNQELRKTTRVHMGVELVLGGKRLYVNSDREQILDLLVSTYDEAMHMNNELQSQQQEIAHANQVLRGLYQISQKLAQARSRREVCEETLTGIVDFPKIEPGWVGLRRADGVLEMVTCEAVATPSVTSLAPTAREACQAVLASEAHAGDTQLVECARADRNDARPATLAITPLRPDGGMLGALVVVTRETLDASDIDVLDTIGHQVTAALQRIELMDSLHQRASELEDVNRELESFGYSVSHDLRAPLRAIDGFSRKLQHHLQALLDTEGRRLLGVINDSCRKMDRLIVGLLEFSHLGRIDLCDEMVDMTGLVQEVIAELRPEADTVRREFVVRSLPQAPGDPVLLRQVWANLLSNAIKYSSEQEAARIEVSATCEAARNVYAVKDNGAGFDMQYYDMLFGVFKRLHNENEFAGTGIGLANVKRIVNRHGGEVWAEGEEGVGATFYFSLPSARETGLST